MNILASPTSSSETLLVFNEGEEEGPFSAADLQEKLDDGSLRTDTPCRLRREREWHDLAFVLKRIEDEEEKTAPAPVSNAGRGKADVSGLGGKSGASGAGIADPVANGVLETLVEINARHCRQLAAIKWSLAATAISAMAIAICLGYQVFEL